MRLPIGGFLLLTAGLALWRLFPGFDHRLFDALRPDGPGSWLTFVTAITRFGGFSTLGPIALAVVIWLLVRKQTTQALWLFATIATGRLAIEGLKLIFARARPPGADHLDQVTSYSMPSSHSAGTMLTWLALAMLVRGRTPALVPLAIAWAFLTGWSRIALGVHWPSDVLAGVGLGMLWVGVARAWLPAS